MRPLVPPYVESLKPYVPGKPAADASRELGLPEVVKLASNENPLGPSPRAVEAMRRAVEEVHLYPEGTSRELTAAVARSLSVPPGQVFVGSGSNEVIELLIRTFTSAGDEALLCRGSFLMYKVALQAHGRRFREVPMAPGFRYDLEAMAGSLTPATRLVFLANPDNPTGTAFGRGALEGFLPRVPEDCLVVLDEAYFEYVAWPDYPNGLHYLARWPNLVVLRTFSKIHGLAGVRLGYGVMRPELVGYLHRTRMPFNVSNLAQAAGLGALSDPDHVRRTRELNLAELPRVREGLLRLGLTVPESHGNFVFADLGRAAAPVAEALLRRGLIVRPIPGYGFPQALRISVGTPDANRRLLGVMAEVLRG
ncbi:MAG TPA: histidinol-phosphate transaminase [Myxococcaceae bacterium]|jgi:histidinol-phosphate aminotransferase|nr:histidinol-phosphate transaminase [Myxococcaceae bacterium]